MRELRQDEEVIAMQAAQWLDELLNGRGDSRAAFAEWIARSPLHVQEFLNISAVQRMFDGLDPERRLDVDAMLTDSGVNVAQTRPRLPVRAPTPALSATAGRVRSRWPVAVAASVLAGAALWWVAAFFQAPVYTTDVGEQRTVELDDGSLVYLNAASRVEARIDSRSRELRLVQGEALFAVVPDGRRAFRVRAGETVVQALGTQFNIHKGERETTVAVIEGAVEVIDSKQARARLDAGQAARVAPDGHLMARMSANAAKATAWRQRRLVFEADALRDIAVEFNRYNRVPKIRIEGDALAERRFTGVLDADNPESLLRILTEADDVTFQKRADELVIRAR
jgi:transmembrane sensor